MRLLIRPRLFRCPRPAPLFLALEPGVGAVLFPAARLSGARRRDTASPARLTGGRRLRGHCYLTPPRVGVPLALGSPVLVIGVDGLPLGALVGGVGVFAMRSRVATGPVRASICDEIRELNQIA